MSKKSREDFWERLREKYDGHLSSLETDLPRLPIIADMPARRKRRLQPPPPHRREILSPYRDTLRDLRGEITRLNAQIARLETSRTRPPPEPAAASDVDTAQPEGHTPVSSQTQGGAAWGLYALAAAGIMGGLLFALSREPALRPPTASPYQAPAPTRSLPFPADRPAGLAIVRGAFTSFDKRSQQIVRLNPGKNRVLEAVSFPYPHTTSIAQSPRGLYSTDGLAGRILLHHPENFSIIEEYPSPGPAPSAIHYGNGELWTADLKTRTVFLHSTASGLRLRGAYSITQKLPVGLYRLGRYLWILDADTRSIARYQIGKKLTPAGNAFLDRHLPRQGRLTGLAVTDHWAWLITERPAALHRVDLRSLRFQ